MHMSERDISREGKRHGGTALVGGAYRYYTSFKRKTR